MKSQRVYRIGIIMVVILYSFALCGCRMVPFPEDHVMVVSQASYAIPGAARPAVPGSMSTIIETDEYGRILFAFNNGFSLNAIGIMQKHDDQHVYYYDNVSYICTEKYSAYTEEQVDDLKEANEWNKALDEEKMIKREFVNKNSLLIKSKSSFDQKELLRVFNATVEDSEKISTTVEDFDKSQTGQTLFLVSRKINKSTTGGYEYVPLDQYLMILNAAGSYDPKNYLIKYDGLGHSNEQLAKIKERNGWVG